MSQITTFSLFQFSSLKQKIWAFGMMQFAHPPLKNVSGQRFYKLMGTGKDRFNPLPDWSVYCILQVWDNEQAAKDYFNDHSLFARYKGNASKHWVCFLKNKISRGAWDGNNPFTAQQHFDENIPLVAALTRATIRPKLLVKFWRFVPKSQNDLWDNPGLLYTRGIGEIPFTQMATFSLWKDQGTLDQFAYQSRAHVDAIGKTRKLKWYKEELFARFQPYKVFGNWVISPELDPIRTETT